MRSSKDTRVKIGLLVIIGLTFIPVWRSGLRENMNLWEWILNHSRLTPNTLEYIPESLYLPDNPVPKKET
jgi:hypothetical protein